MGPSLRYDELHIEGTSAQVLLRTAQVGPLGRSLLRAYQNRFDQATRTLWEISYIRVTITTIEHDRARTWEMS